MDGPHPPRSSLYHCSHLCADRRIWRGRGEGRRTVMDTDTTRTYDLCPSFAMALEISIQVDNCKRMKVADEAILADSCAESHTSVGSGIIPCPDHVTCNSPAMRSRLYSVLVRDRRTLSATTRTCVVTPIGIKSETLSPSPQRTVSKLVSSHCHICLLTTVHY